MSDNITISTLELEDKLPPVLTITPATLVYPPTPPLTPASPGISSAKAIASCSSALPQAPLSPPSVPSDGAHSLQIPLARHLAFMHPNTPKEVIHFVATRLLSRERPHGYVGDWEPVFGGSEDLVTAGVGLDAGKGCKRKDGEAKQKDEKLERMYDVARESFRLLELALPGVSKL